MKILDNVKKKISSFLMNGKTIWLYNYVFNRNKESESYPKLSFYIDDGIIYYENSICDQDSALILSSLAAGGPLLNQILTDSPELTDHYYNLVVDSETPIETPIVRPSEVFHALNQS